MTAAADKSKQQIESLGGHMNGLTVMQQLALSGDKREIAKFESLIFRYMHCAIIGNLQEKFKVSPTTSAGGMPDHSLAGAARSDSLIQQAHGERQSSRPGRIRPKEKGT